jgi:hypothetical protein
VCVGKEEKEKKRKETFHTFVIDDDVEKTNSQSSLSSSIVFQ